MADTRKRMVRVVHRPVQRPAGGGGTGLVQLWDGRLPSLTAHITGFRQYLSGNRNKLRELPWSVRSYQNALLLADSLALKLMTSRLRTAVIALVKSGKTTLINSLTGVRSLHESNVPATSGICVLRHSTDNQFRLFEAVNVKLDSPLAEPAVTGSGVASSGAGSGGSGGSGGAESLSSAAVQLNQCITEGKELVVGRCYQL